MSNITFIDATYIEYRKMWKAERWKFSGQLVQLSIRKQRGQLSSEEMHVLETMNRVVSENNNDWLQGVEDVPFRKPKDRVLKAHR